jgi:WG containing repeat
MFSKSVRLLFLLIISWINPVAAQSIHFDSLIQPNAIPLPTINFDLNFSNCAHGHICCQVMCSCCPELHREQVYDTLVSEPVNGIYRLTIIEQYDLASSHAIGSIQYIFKNKSGQILSSYYSTKKAFQCFTGLPNGKRGQSTPLYTDFRNGIAIVFDSTHDYSLINKTGQKIPIPFHSKIALGNGGYRVSIVFENNRIYGLADSLGNKIGALRYASIGNFGANGLALVQDRQTGLSGFIDRKGTEVIPCKYIEAENFTNNVCQVQNENGWALINSDGERITTNWYSHMDKISEDLINVKRDNKFGFIDLHGKEIIAPEYKWAYPFSEGLSAVCKNDLWGYIDRHGKLIVPIIYDRALNFHNERAAVAVGKDSNYDKWGVIDTKGKIILEPTYDELTEYKNGLSKAFVNGQGEGFIDTKGKIVIPCKYFIDSYGNDSTWFLFEHTVIQTTGQNEHFSLLNSKGEMALDLSQYEFVSQISTYNGNHKALPYLVVHKKDGHCGLIDYTGKTVLTCKYQSLYFESDSIICVSMNEKIGLINLKGKMLLAPDHLRIQLHFEDGLALVLTEKNEFYYINMKGERITEI